MAEQVADRMEDETGGVDGLWQGGSSGEGARGEWSWEAKSRAGWFTRGFKADTSTYSSNAQFMPPQNLTKFRPKMKIDRQKRPHSPFYGAPLVLPFSHGYVH
jgi:hypothetical protein